jgi:ribonuclease Z
VVEITFLGVGSATPAVGGDHVALLVRARGFTVLIDAGPAVMVQLGRQGVTADDVDVLLVTHAHGDHVLGWPMLLFRQRPLTVVAAPETQRVLRELAWLVYPELREPMADRLTFVDLAPGGEWRAGSLRVRSAATCHSADSQAYRIDCEEIGRALTYSGDTGPCDEVRELARGCDLLIHEATYLHVQEPMYGHSTAGQAAQIAAAAGCGALALVHRDREQPEAPDLYEAEVRARYNGMWWLPYAGQSVILSPAGLSIVGDR